MNYLDLFSKVPPRLPAFLSALKLVLKCNFVILEATFSAEIRTRPCTSDHRGCREQRVRCFVQGRAYTGTKTRDTVVPGGAAQSAAHGFLQLLLWSQRPSPYREVWGFRRWEAEVNGHSSLALEGEPPGLERKLVSPPPSQCLAWKPRN